MSVSSAATIAAMQAIASPSAGDVVEVAGYASTDDGGGGTFVFDTTHITDATLSSANIRGATFSPEDPRAIVITAPAHPFVNGQAVLVEGNTVANGAWWVQRLDADRFALLGSQDNAALTPGGTAKSVTVTTSGPHRLAPGGRAIIDRVSGTGGFSLNGTWMNIGMGATAESFTLAQAPPGAYAGGGVVGDGGLSFPSTPLPVPVPTAHREGRWVRRRDDTELNVKWFGAGDGTDDTAAIVATIRAARRTRTSVYLPGGVFKVTAEIKLETYGLVGLTDFGLSIRGDGSEENAQGGTMITAGRAGMRSMLSVQATNMTIKGVRFNCASQADHGLYLQGAAKLHLDDVHVVDAVKDGCRVVNTDDVGNATNNDGVYARELSASRCGTMYCSPSIADRYDGTLRAVTRVDGTVSCEVPNLITDGLTITGSGTKFRSIPARAGDFIVIGANDDATLQRFEIASIDSDTQITIYGFLPPSLNRSGQLFAIGVGDGWSEQPHIDNNRARMDTGNFTACAGSGVVCRGSYGPLLEHQEFLGCGFAGIVIGTLDKARGLFFNTRISNPYFEATPFYGGCIFLAQARGITIDQPMWFNQPDHRRLVISDIVSNNAGIVGILAEYPPNANVAAPGGGVGVHPIGSATRIDVPATRGSNFTNFGTLTLPSGGAAASIASSPLTTPMRVIGRNLNIVIDRNTLDGPADITATPTFSAGADGQEIAVCNVADFPVTFHDSRGPGALKTTLILDCEPGGSVSLDVGQIMMLYYSTTNQMALKWTQRGAIATSVPVISSVVPNEASAVGGDLITVTGTNLARPTVIVGSGSSTGPIAITEPTATSFKFTMPPRSAGTHNVLVTTGRGASNVLPIKLR